jgi:hypothetical protein
MLEIQAQKAFKGGKIKLDKLKKSANKNNSQHTTQSLLENQGKFNTHDLDRSPSPEGK